MVLMDFIVLGVCILCFLGLFSWYKNDPKSFKEACKSKEITHGIECPNCKSTSTHRISRIREVSKYKSWECSTCHYRW